MDNKDLIDDHTRVVKGLEDFVKDNLSLFLPVDELWQPSDLLPNFSNENERLITFRRDANKVPDEVLVVLVGDIITEEALPTYQTWLNRIEAIKDHTGIDNTAWGLATKWWTAEENRHGTLLYSYLRLNSNVDTRSIEETIQYLIRNGFDIRAGNDPYKTLIYTTFQERATHISHINVARLARRYGDENLYEICMKVASDEKRHETFYKRVMKKIFERDPNDAMLAFKEMMEKKIVMPAEQMYDGRDPKLFDHYSIVAQRINVYTILDYAEIIKDLVKSWEISKYSVSGEAAEAQGYLSGLAQKYKDKAEAMQRRINKQPKLPFSWIKNRIV